MENKEELEQSLAVSEETKILDFSNSRKNSEVEVTTFSNIKDKKKLFNLQSHVDSMINDCVGESIRVKEVLVRKFEKPLKEPVIDEETGEIIKDKEINYSCVLIDDNGKSYATGSKTFVINLMTYLGDFEGSKELEKGIDIKIVKVSVQNSPNKALGFELI